MASEQPKQYVEATVSNRTVVRVIAMIVATIFAFQALRSVAGVLQLIFIAFFLAVALSPAVRFIKRRLRLKGRISATIIVYIFFIGIIGSLVAYVLPPLISQTVDFISDAPRMIENLQNQDNAVGRLVERYNLGPQIEGFSDNLRSRTADLQEPVVATAGRLGSALISIVTVLVLTFMMLVEGPKWINRYWRLQPKERREHHQYLGSKMYRVITGYVNGQVLMAVIGASFAFVALVVASTLLGVTINAVALAGILVFTGLIPMIGATIGGTIVVLACLFVSVPLAIIMAVFYILYQQIENVSLQPYIQSKFNELSPLLVFVAALLGIGVGGFLGALIAIPTAGCLKILLLDYLERRGKGLDI